MLTRPGPHEVRYLFIDFNAFFASVEQHDDPSLRGRPIIVTPLESEYSGAIAASYEARALGIVRGTSAAEARQLCPGIAIRAARHDRYVAVHDLLMKEIGRHIPVVQVCSIDECLCALDRTEAGHDRARAKALEIKHGIARNIGASLTASIGLAASPLLAKLASELVKPDGLTLIDNSMLPDALTELPLRAIPGIGKGVEARLLRAGVRDFRSLWNLQPKQARAIWGSVEGERFCYGLHGYDIRRAEPGAKRMIGHSRVLSGSYREPEGARIVARALILKAASRLRYYELHAGAMHLNVKLEDGGTLSHEAIFRPTQSSWRFLRELDAFWLEHFPTIPDRRDGVETGPLQGARRERCRSIVTDEQGCNGPVSARRGAVAPGNPLDSVASLAGAVNPLLRAAPRQRVSWCNHDDPEWSGSALGAIKVACRKAGGRARMKLVSCYLHDLRPEPPQPDLFVTRESDAGDARQAHLWRIIDDLNRRYGKETVVLGSQKGLDLNYLGVKIAFSRVPEAAEFEC